MRKDTKKKKGNTCIRTVMHPPIVLLAAHTCHAKECSGSIWCYCSRVIKQHVTSHQNR